MSIADFAEETPKETSWAEQAVNNSVSVTPVNPTTPNAPVQENVTASPVESTSTVTTEQVTPSPEPVASNPQPQVNDIAAGLMAKIGPIGQNSYFKWLIYGEPGTTKSSISATAPNNLVVDLEDGLIAAKNSPHGIADNVRAYPWNNFEEFYQLIEALNNNHPAFDWVKVVTIDTFSDMHKRGLAETMMREYYNRPNSVNPYKAETEQHAENNERMIRLVRALKDLNRDLIIVTHARTVEPKNKPAKTYADFSEGLSNRVMAMMDVVGYISWMDDGTGTFVPVMRTQSEGTIHCKTRISLPPLMPNPTYGQVRAAWEESKNR